MGQFSDKIVILNKFIYLYRQVETFQAPQTGLFPLMQALEIKYKRYKTLYTITKRA